MEILNSLLEQYGLLIILVGTFLEGETIVILAGFSAHQGLLNPYAVSGAAFCGSFTGDQFWFYLARHYRTHRLVLKAVDRPAFQRAIHFLEHHPTIFILSFRFIYGVRNVSPIVIGLSDISAMRFFILNALAAAIWATAFTSVGYLFADTAENILGDLERIEHAVLILIITAVIIYALYRTTKHHFHKHKL